MKFVTVGHDDQCTKGEIRVKEKGCVEFVMNSTEYRVSSSNVMKNLVEMTGLIILNVMREQRELNGVPL